MAPDTEGYAHRIHQALEDAVRVARGAAGGSVANYIPELRAANEELISGAICLSDGGTLTAGDNLDTTVTLQSVSKLILFTGLLEHCGEESVLNWVDVEPSGKSFAAIGKLENPEARPSNPLINAGAIALSAHVPGATRSERLHWVDQWMKEIFGGPLKVDPDIARSELSTGHKNRSIAHLMKSTGVITGDPEAVLEVYYHLCSHLVSIRAAAHLPMLFANGGLDCTGRRIFSESTSNTVVSVMATCGAYNDSGSHLVKTGMPCKTGVSGLMVAVATGRAGVAFLGPALNSKGTTVKGLAALEHLSRELHWHFAAPWAGASRESRLHDAFE